MTEQTNERVGRCPSWCRTMLQSGAQSGAQSGRDDAVHAHASEDITVGDSAYPMSARMVQPVDSEDVHVVLGQQVVGVEEAEKFAHALLRLTSAARLAGPGLGFVEVLAGQADLSTGEMALAAGLEVERVRAQRAGGQVLSSREFDRLALAVAQLVPLKALQG